MTRISIAILALLFAGCQTSASAGWPHDYLDQQAAKRSHVEHYKHRHHKPKVIYRTIVKPAATSRCMAPLTREGDQYATQTGAKAEADKAWMQAARWLYGESHMDLHYAESIAYACGRSSVGSVAGQTFMRCEVTARPCRAPKIGE